MASIADMAHQVAGRCSAAEACPVAALEADLPIPAAGRVTSPPRLRAPPPPALPAQYRDMHVGLREVVSA
ncbi:hypothetical protein [Candidatus Poriferisodalis sp.]|uniref:hypothetical protein n=1 Tax=Candidatus Poriferisodalis sp. TaxID=3101277 RepID=UPI003D12E539